MKSHMKCFSIFALIAFGFGYSDLLVRPSAAHFDLRKHSHRPGIVDYGPSPVEVAVHMVISLYEWLDGCYGDIQDYFEEKRKEQLREDGGGGTVSSGDESVYQGLGALTPPPAGMETNTNQGVSTNPNPPCYPSSGNPADPPCK